MKNIQPIAIAVVVLVAIATILIIGITISQQALAATNLNGSKSNIYEYIRSNPSTPILSMVL